MDESLKRKNDEISDLQVCVLFSRCVVVDVTYVHSLLFAQAKLDPKKTKTETEGSQSDSETEQSLSPNDTTHHRANESEPQGDADVERKERGASPSHILGADAAETLVSMASTTSASSSSTSPSPSPPSRWKCPGCQTILQKKANGEDSASIIKHKGGNHGSHKKKK